MLEKKISLAYFVCVRILYIIRRVYDKENLKERD